MFRVASATSRRGTNGSSSNLLATGGSKRGLGPGWGVGGSARCVPPHVSWRALARASWLQYASLTALLLVVRSSDQWSPFKRSVYHLSDAQLWRYSYPLRGDTVSSELVTWVGLAAPAATLLAHHFVGGRISRLEAHHASLLAVAAVLATGLVTNLIKLNVGRPRPDFVFRCWPNGAPRSFSPDGIPICSPDAIDVDEGLKSFPSGHTSWSASSAAFLSSWLLGNSRAFAGGAGPLHICLAAAPLLLALWVGMTRIQDYWHHWEDVSAGFALGSAISYAFYRTLYPSLQSDRAGTPHPVTWPSSLVAEPVPAHGAAPPALAEEDTEDRV